MTSRLSRFGPAVRRLQLQNILIDAHELREALCQYAEVAGLQLASGSREHDDARTPGYRGDVLAQHTLERDDRQHPAVPVESAEQPVMRSRVALRLRVTNDFGHAGSRHDQALTV